MTDFWVKSVSPGGARGGGEAQRQPEVPEGDHEIPEEQHEVPEEDHGSSLSVVSAEGLNRGTQGATASVRLRSELQGSDLKRLFTT